MDGLGLHDGCSTCQQSLPNTTRLQAEKKDVNDASVQQTSDANWTGGFSSTLQSASTAGLFASILKDDTQMHLLSLCNSCFQSPNTQQHPLPHPFSIHYYLKPCALCLSSFLPCHPPPPILDASFQHPLHPPFFRFSWFSLHSSSKLWTCFFTHPRSPLR